MPLADTIERMRSWDRIVGGGSAGAIVAARLAEKGASVLLIEAGPEYPDGSAPEEIRFLYGLASSDHPRAGSVLWDLVGSGAHDWRLTARTSGSDG